MKLTAKSVAALKLPHGKRDAIEFDDAIPGFGLRLREGGSRTWVFQYKFGARHRRMVLGRATAIPADKARQIAAISMLASGLGEILPTTRPPPWLPSSSARW